MDWCVERKEEKGGGFFWWDERKGKYIFRSFFHLWGSVFERLGYLGNLDIWMFGRASGISGIGRYMFGD